MRQMRIAGTILAIFLLVTGCSNSEQQTTAAERSTTTGNELAPGHTGGCKDGFTIYSQRQFEPYGTTIRRMLDGKGESVGLRGNDKLTAVGWVRTEQVFYPNNPVGIRGEVWYYVPHLPNGGSGWMSDAAYGQSRRNPLRTTEMSSTTR